MKKFSCSVLLTPIAIILQIVIVCGLGLILRAGTGSFDNKNHLPAMPDLYVALVSLAGNHLSQCPIQMSLYVWVR